MPALNNAASPERLVYLDSARGLAAISVSSWHFLLAVFGLDLAGWHFHSPFRLLWYGEADVLFFFIHSGFILSYSLVKRGWKLNTGYYGRFLIERIFRIYPLYLAILVISYLVFLNVASYTASGPNDWISRFWFSRFDWNSVAQQSLLVYRIPESANYRLIPQDWTLTVELLAGATIPLLAISGRRNFLYFIVLLALLKFSGWFSSYIFEFGLGVALFLFYDEIVATWKRSARYLKWVFAAVAIVLYSGLFIFPTIYAKDIVIIDPRWDRVLVDAGCVAVFVILLASAHVQRWLSHPLLVRIGKACFSIYLIHKLLLLAAWHTWPEFFSGLAAGAIPTIVFVFIGFMLLLLSLSLLGYAWLEKPMNTLGKKLAAGMQRSMQQLFLTGDR